MTGSLSYAVYQPRVTVCIKFISDSRIINMKSRLVMQSIQNDGSV